MLKYQFAELGIDKLKELLLGLDKNYLDIFEPGRRPKFDKSKFNEKLFSALANNDLISSWSPKDKKIIVNNKKKF